MINTRLKERAIIHYLHFLGSLREVSRLYSVSKSSLARWVRQDIERTQQTQDEAQTVRNTRYSSCRPWLDEYVRLKPYGTCSHVRAAFLAQHGFCPSQTTVYRMLGQIHVSYKRAQLSRSVSGLKDHPLYHESAPYNNVIAIDECHFQASDHVRYGWCRKNERLPRRKSDRPQRLSLLLAVSKHGVVESRLVRGSVNSLVFIDFLRHLPAGATLLLDNASIHRAKIVRDFCAARDTTLNYIPPYCPWYNPAEYAFSKIKSVYRRARLTSEDFDADVRYAVTQLPCMKRSFLHAEDLWRKDVAILKNNRVGLETALGSRDSGRPCHRPISERGPISNDVTTIYNLSA